MTPRLTVAALICHTTTRTVLNEKMMIWGIILISKSKQGCFRFATFQKKSPILIIGFKLNLKSRAVTVSMVHVAMLPVSNNAGFGCTSLWRWTDKAEGVARD
eukprot:scaffold31518_cov56-Cyclotella_meneghiniana.AAC.10